mmetsp:Transcript_23916/g.71442  ORF Transcript_23916/g.71442 Transcript_23916/m.71442 type:complete len:303 (+) Transcript_23916:71-979(+)
MALVMQLRALALAALCGGAAAARRSSGSPSWQEQLAEAKEVSALSDRIHTTKVMIAKWRTMHTKARDFHERQRRLIQKQIAIRKRQQDAMQEQLEDYQALQEEHYKNKMCMMLMQAFHLGGEDDAKVKVLKVCHGLRKLSLAAPTSGRRSSWPWPRAALDRAARTEGAWDGQLSSRLGRIVHSLAATERRLKRRSAASVGASGGSLRGQAPDLEARLKELQGLLNDIRAEYSRDRAQWAAERAELSKAESSLGDEVLDLHMRKQAVSQAAAKKSEDLFCPVVKANYGVSDEKIMAHVVSECQ